MYRCGELLPVPDLPNGGSGSLPEQAS
jgi:hypothetical protein